tara:strand:+ start:5680 stop:6840 length:1161 start_codon:yes stop_codon:yes gene_type:complete
MKNILFIHQSADLYGSDKTLLYLVESIKNEFNPIVVVPEVGPLTEELKKINVEVLIIPVIKVSRQLLTSLEFFTIPYQIFNAVKILKKKLNNRKIDIIHSNTIAVFLGAFYSKIYKIKHVWHVHEIIQHPKIVANSYPFLVNKFADFVIFNSLASAEQLYKGKPKLKEKSKIIYNGLDRNVSFSSIEEKTESRKKIFQSIDESSILLGLVGRINRHKGQHLLLNVFGQLKKEGIDNIYLLFLGSTIKTQTFFLDVLQNEIKKKQLENVVTIVDFQKEIWKYYDAMDIVLVPTIDPEPFGLVAVEGMLSKKPVIAANHGGLKEIVVHHKTGLLFEPNSALDLKKSILEIIQNQKLIELFGSEGEERAKNKFSLQEYVNNFKAFYNSF